MTLRENYENHSKKYIFSDNKLLLTERKKNLTKYFQMNMIKELMKV